MDLPLESLLEFALDAAWQAGRITLGYFHTHVAVERKGDNSTVTQADREAEQKLRELISHAWPDHGIVSEEFGQISGNTELTWIIAPIDGTKSFIHGVPLYGVLVALTDNTEPLVGIAHFPALNETVYAAHGLGCFWNGRRAHVSRINEMKEATLLASEVAMEMDKAKSDTWRRLIKATSIQRTWGDAYGYALVATGRAEIMLDEQMQVWDAAPLQVILEEAGGTFTDWNGTPTIHGKEGIATNGALFDPVMALVRGA